MRRKKTQGAIKIEDAIELLETGAAAVVALDQAVKENERLKEEIARLKKAIVILIKAYERDTGEEAIEIPGLFEFPPREKMH